MQPADSSDSDSDSDGDSDSSGTTGGPPPQPCMDTEFDYVLLAVAEETSFDIGAVCTVEDTSVSIDVEFLDLVCPVGDIRLLSNAVGFGDYFEPEDSVELVAAGETGLWQHVALLDARGAFIMGSYDLSPEAPDLTDVFLAVDFQPFDTDCESEAGTPGCGFHRAGVEYTLDGQTQSSLNGIAIDLGPVRIYTAAVMPDDTPECSGEVAVAGYFTLVTPP